MTISSHNNYPVGFRFQPTDIELVNHYLKNKLLGIDDIENNVIAEVDFCKYEPWDLPAFSIVKSNDPEWFFFCRLNCKYANSKKINRATKCGFWKLTGKDRKIKIMGTNKVIGVKKTLVYRSVDPNYVKTNWIIHEYHDVTLEENQRTFVLCRLMKKADEEDDEGEPSRQMSSNNEILETTEGILEGVYEAEKYFPFPTQQTSTSNSEQKISIPDLMDDFEADIEIPVFKSDEEEKKFEAFVRSFMSLED